MPLRAPALLAVLAVLAAGCGSDKRDVAKTATPAPTVANDATVYRDAVNTLFDRILAAGGKYKSAHGRAEVRAAGLQLDGALQAAVLSLGSIQPPADARRLHASLRAILTQAEDELRRSLSVKRVDRARVDEAVRGIAPAEVVVGRIDDSQ